MNTNKKSKNYIKSPWDKINSTFKQYVRYFDGRVLFGYSKKLSYPELGDPYSILTGWIMRMYASDYLQMGNGVESIEYRFNFGSNEPVVRLYSSYYEVLNSSDYWEPFWIFLDHFYRLINNRTPKDEIILSYYQSINSKSVDLDPTKPRFRSEFHLREFARRNVSSGKITQAQADRFIDEYIKTHRKNS